VRQHGGQGSPVVFLDIDGTLGDHHSHFKRCAAMYTGRNEILDRIPGKDFARSLGLGKPLYREIKLAYRRGGWKRSMPVFPYAQELTRNVRKVATLVLATTRPWLNHDGIDKDTVHWCRRHGITYDYLFFGGHHKYRAAVHAYADYDGMAVAALDDLPEMVWQAIDVGVECAMLRSASHNLEEQDLARIFSLEGAEEAIMETIDNWHARRK
jgi:5'(3')-deoxyribonucleotidase